MAARLILTAEVEQDIDDAYGWYEQRQFGLGEDFVARVEGCLEAIRRTPDMHAVVHEGYRRASVRRFPYSVFYESSGDTVTVYCIFHTSRDPRTWRDRLP